MFRVVVIALAVITPSAHGQSDTRKWADTPLPKVVNQFGQPLNRGAVGVPRGPTFDSPNQGVLAYAQDKLAGRAVGDEVCWTLVDWALVYAGANRPDSRSYGKKVSFSEAQPGDIVLFQKVRLPSGFSADSHVAILSAVDGNKVNIIHQNAGNTPADRRWVRQDWLDLSGHSGTITYWRPQPR